MARWLHIILLGLGLGVGAAQAQDPGGGPVAYPDFAADPVPIQGPQFCPPPAPPAQQVASPFVDTHGEPNAFNADGGSPPMGSVLWFGYERLFWQSRDDRVNTTLVTSSTAPDLNDNFGALGQSATRTLIGNQDLDVGVLGGDRITIGLNPGWHPYFEFIAFWLNEDDTLFDVSSSGAAGSPLLARPVLGLQLANQAGLAGNGDEIAFISGFPGVAAGSITIESTQSVWGLEPTAIFPLSPGPIFVDLTVAYRHLDLNEGLYITSTTAPIDPAFVIPFNGDPNGFGVGTQVLVNDVFQTRNQFDGGQVGFRTGMILGRFGFMLDTKMGVGNTSQSLWVDGFSTLTQPGVRTLNNTTVPGGLLAVESNSGRITNNDVSFVGEVGAHLGVDVTRWLKLHGGYSVLYWSNVVRPGQQLSNVVDTRQVPTDPDFDPAVRGTAPPRLFETSDFWLQGFQFGVTFSF